MLKCVHAHMLYVFVFMCVCACVCSTRWGAMPRCRGLCCECRAMIQACGNKPSFSPLSPTLSHSSHPVYLCFTPGDGEVVCREHCCGKTHTHMCKGHQTLRKRMIMWLYVYTSMCDCFFFFLLTQGVNVYCCCLLTGPMYCSKYTPKDSD